MTQPNPDMEETKTCPVGCIGWTAQKRDDRIAVMRRAHFGTAAESLSELLMHRAMELFSEGDDKGAAIWRDASKFARDWAKNERECQARLEKTCGRYDG